MKTTKVGIIGCGMISDAYFKASSKFNILEVAACSDIIPERSAKKNEMYGVPNVTNEELLANPEIEIVINLTPPQVHSKIAMDALNAGKHTHSEKPFGVDAADAAKVTPLASNIFVKSILPFAPLISTSGISAKTMLPSASNESV